ncbi:isochorismatase family protein [Nonomuraea turcica]|uniref:isochorismatase family protein n=1 Tax=Nonomuraea sp. G32 TaxID=3067274 RepID=UPI00273BF0DC|nr:isochorismatase family protein [Nonomuraea sp. G32]MDP4510227.1 isochorismatase family protein [Nonomuraea sp. G32]
MTTTALIVGDLQAGIVDNYPFAAGVLPVVEKVLPAARASGIPVIFIRFGLRASGLDVAAGNLLISGLHGAGTLFHEESPETLVHPRIAPRAHPEHGVRRRHHLGRADEFLLGVALESAPPGEDLLVLLFQEDQLLHRLVRGVFEFTQAAPGPRFRDPSAGFASGRPVRGT